MRKNIRNLIFRSKYLWLFATPLRLRDILKFNWVHLKISFRWLFTQSEFTNYNYDLTELNKKYLISFISFVTGAKYSTVSEIFSEVDKDSNFFNYVVKEVSKIERGYELPKQPYFGRRLGWYALVRILKPQVVVETGTDKGLGTILIAHALKMNGSGVVYSLDKDPFSGSLIDKKYWSNINLFKGDSLQNLSNISNVDMFIHDSDHSETHELAEYQAVENNLSPKNIILSDNSEYTSALLDWSIKKNRNFVSFKEIPKDHWYPGDGIGISLSE